MGVEEDSSVDVHQFTTGFHSSTGLHMKRRNFLDSAERGFRRDRGSTELPPDVKY